MAEEDDKSVDNGISPEGEENVESVASGLPSLRCSGMSDTAGANTNCATTWIGDSSVLLASPPACSPMPLLLLLLLLLMFPVGGIGTGLFPVPPPPPLPATDTVTLMPSLWWTPEISGRCC